MTDGTTGGTTDGGASNPFAGLAATLGGSGGAVNPRLADPEFYMDRGQMTGFANRVVTHGEALTDMAAGIRKIHLPVGTFGVIGGSLNGVHSKVRDDAAEAVTKGRQVLDSWKKALDQARSNAEEAEKASKTGNGNGDGLNGLGGGAKAGGLPKGLGLGGMPKLGANGGVDPKDLGKGLGDDWKQPDLSGKGPSGSDLPGTNPNGTDLPGTDLPNTNLPPTDLPNTDPGGGLNQNGLNQNGLNGTGLDPNATGLQTPKIPGDTALSGYNPSLPPAATTPPGFDPSAYGPGGTGTGTGTGSGGAGGYGSTGYGSSAGYGSGAYGSGTASGSGGAGRAGVGGVPAMPYAPMGAGAGSGDEGKDRARGPAVPEDESTWFGDEDVAPAVLGMQEES